MVVFHVLRDGGRWSHDGWTSIQSCEGVLGIELGVGSGSLSGGGVDSRLDGSPLMDQGRALNWVRGTARLGSSIPLCPSFCGHHRYGCLYPHLSPAPGPERQHTDTIAHHRSHHTKVSPATRLNAHLTIDPKTILIPSNLHIPITSNGSSQILSTSIRRSQNLFISTFLPARRDTPPLLTSPRQSRVAELIPLLPPMLERVY